MRDFIESWSECFLYLISDDLISYYAFFTTILAECVYLWGDNDLSTTFPFILILAGYILNVVIFGLLKSLVRDFVVYQKQSDGSYKRKENKSKMRLISALYIIVFIVLFIIGCFIDLSLSIVLTIIPFAITGLWVFIRGYQCSSGAGIKFIRRLLNNIIIWIISQIIVVGGPLFVLVYLITINTNILVALKFIIPIVYLFCMPFISYLEDIICYNVFEIAYEDLV